MKLRVYAMGCGLGLATGCGTASSGDENVSCPTPESETAGPTEWESAEWVAAESADPFPERKPGIAHFPGGLVLPNTRPVLGRSFDAIIESWWHWRFAVPADANPGVVLDADCGVGQDGRVFFVSPYDGARTFERRCHIPFGKPVLVPVWIVINDYPCPDPAFEPAPGQSLEDFLRQGAVAYNDAVTDLRVRINGRAIGLAQHRNTGDLFEFEAHPSLIGKLPDPCLQGTKQPGVSDGFWLVIVPQPGDHVVRIRATDPAGDAIDYTYRLTVER